MARLCFACHVLHCERRRVITLLLSSLMLLILPLPLPFTFDFCPTPFGLSPRQIMRACVCVAGVIPDASMANEKWRRTTPGRRQLLHEMRLAPVPGNQSKSGLADPTGLFTMDLRLDSHFRAPWPK